jgi:small-conductance mechanosensitive channel
VRALLLMGWAAVAAPAPAEGAATAAPVALAGAVSTQIRHAPAILTLYNRSILIMRGSLFNLSPEERAQLANQRLRALTRHSPIGPISAAPMEEGVAIKIGDEIAFGIAPGDLDAVAGESMEAAAAAALRRLQAACTAIDEQRSLSFLLHATLMTLGAVLVAVAVLWGVRRVEKKVIPAVRRSAARVSGRLAGAGRAWLSYALGGVTTAARLPFWFLYGMAFYSCLTFCLGRFPYTSVWADTMGEHIWAITTGLLRAFVAWLPDLLVIVIIITLTRVLSKVVQGIFRDIEEGRLKAGWCDPLSAKPTARILGAVLWLFALVMIYPYLPGSDSAAFKGVSVFVGLLMSLGASGVIGQVVGGFVLMYSRALQPGDYVRIGEDEGTVEAIGFLATKIRTPKRVAINIPNALLLSATSKNYSAQSGKDGVIIPTSVTIGYNTPWRQVHAMLQEAAKRTPGAAGPPAPFVLQTALGDFHVEYQLNVFLRSPRERMRLLSQLHANIQDVFNEYGVQIMSPNYEADPPEKVWVPKEKWFAAPAAAPPQQAPKGSATTGARAGLGAGANASANAGPKDG